MPIRVIYPSILSRDQLGLSTGLGAAGCCRCFCAEEPHEMLWEYVGSLQPHVICIYYMYIYIYMLYVYIIYVIDIRGNRLTEGTSMY